MEGRSIHNNVKHKLCDMCHLVKKTDLNFFHAHIYIDTMLVRYTLKLYYTIKARG